MQEAGFEPTLPLYVATGLLSYGAELEFQGGVNMLVRSHLCSEVLYKEQYIPIFELQRKRDLRARLLGKQPLSQPTRAQSWNFRPWLRRGFACAKLVSPSAGFCFTLGGFSCAPCLLPNSCHLSSAGLNSE